MGCSGHCEVQIYDFDFDDVQVIEISPAQSEYEPCKQPPSEDIANAILEQFAKANPPLWQDTPSDTRGCQGENCVCIPSQPPDDAWTAWAAYDLTSFKFAYGATAVKGGPDIVSPAKPCVWEISGEYWVSSATTGGNCMTKPKRIRRPKNPKRPVRPKKASVAGGNLKQKAGRPKVSRRRTRSGS
jgi:hypothetical protein